VSCHLPTSAFERTSKRRKGFPSEQRVKKGDRVVHGDKELIRETGPQRPVSVRLSEVVSSTVASSLVTSMGLTVTITADSFREGGSNAALFVGCANMVRVAAADMFFAASALGLVGWICSQSLVDRFDAMAANMVCQAQGESLAELEAALSPKGVKFEARDNGFFRVGYSGKLTMHWVCVVSLNSDGRIAGSQSLR